MNMLSFAGILSLVPAAVFSITSFTHVFARSAGEALLADLGLGGKTRLWLEALLLVTMIFLVLPQFRVAGVIIAAMEMMVFGLSMLNHAQYRYAVPALIVLATLPLALPAPQ